MRSTLASTSLALLLAGGPAAADASSVKPPTLDALALVRSSAAFQDFARLLAKAEAAGVDHHLGGDGPVTVLAPTDRALANLSQDLRRRLFVEPDRETLRSFLLGHVVAGRLTAADLAERSGVRALSGRRLPVEHKFGRLVVGRAAIKAANIPATNGVVHSVSGAVALPERDVAGLARSLPGYATFASLLEASGLPARLRRDGPFTVFAPSDAALARLPEGRLEALRDAGRRDELRAFLKRHVVRGRVYAEDAMRRGALETLAGTRVAFRIEDGRETVGGVPVVLADRDGSDGVLHGVGGVLPAP